MTTGLPSISEIIRRRRSALFGHVARLPQDVPAHKTFHCRVDLSLNRPPNDQWKCRPGRPRERWIDQVRKDNGIPRRTCGGVRLLVVTEEQCYGPRWLRDNDDLMWTDFSEVDRYWLVQVLLDNMEDDTVYSCVAL